MKRIRLIMVFGALVSFAGCAGLPDVVTNVGKVALDRAGTVSSALALRDGYIDLKAQIIANASSFSEEEQALLTEESLKVEGFYNKIITLARGGTASQILVNSSEFLSSVIVVRSSVDRAIEVIQPKMSELNPEGVLAVAGFISDYRKFSDQLDVLLAKNDRADAVRAASTFLKFAVPVIASLL